MAARDLELKMFVDDDDALTAISTYTLPSDFSEQPFSRVYLVFHPATRALLSKLLFPAPLSPENASLFLYLSALPRVELGT